MHEYGLFLKNYFHASKFNLKKKHLNREAEKIILDLQTTNCLCLLKRYQPKC